MENILIFGPIGDRGGRELETGFIAKVLSEDHRVRILSSGNLTNNSQVFDFVPCNSVFSINELVFRKNIWFRFLSRLSGFRSHQSKHKYAFVNNTIAKKTGYRRFALKQVYSQLDDCSVVILCAQIVSEYVKEIVSYAKSKEIPVVFRTSMTIRKDHIVGRDWLNDINLFIHHSKSNAKSLNKLRNHNYKIIDQCAYIEEELLKIKATHTAKTILYAGRISKEKGIVDFANDFNRLQTRLELVIVGDGSQMHILETIAKNNSKIQLKGFLSQEKIVDEMKDSDIILVPSLEESGPLIGLEAMAAGRLILSTKVGAMPERLNGLPNQFWFRNNDFESLAEAVQKIENLSKKDISSIAEENRKRYLNKYTLAQIKSQYKNAILEL